jgi:hypothetical protein
MEYRRPSRDVPAPRPNRLGAASRPPAGIRLLGACSLRTQTRVPLVCEPQRCIPSVLGPRSFVATTAVAFLSAYVARNERGSCQSVWHNRSHYASPFLASLLFKCWDYSRTKAHSIFSPSCATLELGPTMSAIGSPGAGDVGGGGALEKRRPGHPKGSRKESGESGGNHIFVGFPPRTAAGQQEQENPSRPRGRRLWVC